jgi:tRNA(adenine34) deaminase
MIAITAASNFLGAKYLTDCTLYVTLEPCVMCAAALKWAQLGRLVYGAPDPREGFSRLREPLLHKKTKKSAGILDQPSTTLLHQFFLDRRNQKN